MHDFGFGHHHPTTSYLSISNSPFSIDNARHTPSNHHSRHTSDLIQHDETHQKYYPIPGLGCGLVACRIHLAQPPEGSGCSCTARTKKLHIDTATFYRPSTRCITFEKAFLRLLVRLGACFTTRGSIEAVLRVFDEKSRFTSLHDIRR